MTRIRRVLTVGHAWRHGIVEGGAGVGELEPLGGRRCFGEGEEVVALQGLAAPLRCLWRRVLCPDLEVHKAPLTGLQEETTSRLSIRAEYVQTIPTLCPAAFRFLWTPPGL